jgi:hypothetical protein
MEAKNTRHYGKMAGYSKPIPDHYNQNTELQTGFEGKVLAKGKWTKAGFYVLQGSRIMQEFLGQNNNNAKQVLLQLKEDNIVIEAYPYYILKNDILVSSPSMAACLVHGNNRTGFRDWEYNGKNLQDLIKM